MSLLIALLIGVAMGVITGLWFKRNADYLLVDILTGVAGSILGLFLWFLDEQGALFGLFSWRGAVMEFIGAAVFIGLYQLIVSLPKQKHKHVKDGES